MTQVQKILRYISIFLQYIYRPQTKYSKFMFLHILSFCSGGGSASVHAGILYPLGPNTLLGQAPPGPGTPWDQAPPGTRHPSHDRTHPPWTRYPPGPGTPLPRLGTPHMTRHLPLDQAPPMRSACWEIQSTSGWYASYWNAVLSDKLAYSCNIFRG